MRVASAYADDQAHAQRGLDSVQLEAAIAGRPRPALVALEHAALAHPLVGTVLDLEDGGLAQGQPRLRIDPTEFQPVPIAITNFVPGSPADGATYCQMAASDWRSSFYLCT